MLEPVQGTAANPAERITAEAASMVGKGPLAWTEDVERIAALLESNGWARQYIALCLLAESEQHRAWSLSGTTARSL